jgi:hypothetical protein
MSLIAWSASVSNWSLCDSDRLLTLIAGISIVGRETFFFMMLTSWCSLRQPFLAKDWIYPQRAKRYTGGTFIMSK